MPSVRTILHATDFSKPAAYAFELACTLARAQGAKLVVLHVATPPPVVLPEGIITDANNPEYVAGLKKQLLNVRPADAQLNVEHRLEQGDPAGETLRVAEEIAADWIVLGTHGRSGLFRLLMGSVAEAVLRKARCSVLTVRMALGDKA